MQKAHSQRSLLQSRLTKETTASIKPSMLEMSEPRQKQSTSISFAAPLKTPLKNKTIKLNATSVSQVAAENTPSQYRTTGKDS